MKTTHTHHIIPKYMGGTDDPSNLDEVNIETHIKLHKQLWEDLGNWQDYVAWKMLSGQMSKQECIKIKQSEGGKKNKGKLVGQKNPFYGKKHSTETIKRISEKKKGNIPGNKGLFGLNNPQSKKYKITFPDGKTKIIIGLTQFCRENNLTYQTMCAVASGRVKQHKLFKCERIL